MCPLLGGATKLSSQHRSDRLVVVGRPGVVHRGGRDAHLTRQNRWPRTDTFNFLGRNSSMISSHL